LQQYFQGHAICKGNELLKSDGISEAARFDASPFNLHLYYLWHAECKINLHMDVVLHRMALFVLKSMGFSPHCFFMSITAKLLSNPKRGLHPSFHRRQNSNL
jgi:hypothetical protein